MANFFYYTPLRTQYCECFGFFLNKHLILNNYRITEVYKRVERSYIPFTNLPPIIASYIFIIANTQKLTLVQSIALTQISPVLCTLVCVQFYAILLQVQICVITIIRMQKCSITTKEPLCFALFIVNSHYANPCTPIANPWQP